MRVFRFAIDRGGTFTDVYAEMDVLDTQGNVVDVRPKVIKLLSEDPANYPDAPREGIRRVLEVMTGVPHPRDQPVDTTKIQSIRMGTTVATNALLERNGERTVLVTTKGFHDLLYIGNQSRPKIFDLEIHMPDTLYDSVIEVDERLQLVNNENDRLPTDEKGISGDFIRVIKDLDVEDLTKKLQAARDDGVESVAIVLLHSYTFPRHEEKVRDIAIKLGFTQVSLSSEVMPMVKVVPRGFTTCADAYLTPVIKKYVATNSAQYERNRWFR
ncbi:5-oxoprolinase [Phytophthora palmivora]|uniref:5-oxoprolinase n=1 Tax=Phytophthora palmivora TaxID=4796 RepID=A0A2P4XRP8_9STRA|nr:5-oxoprolinase [Phytophthora palmivora]